MTEKLSQNELLSLTTEIVASHLSNNTVAVSDIPS
jgi:predicted transcriptional regulator